ncbi:MAG TPA: glycosyltransferase family 61 protein [Methylovirgula sp.]|nr:glycosyltransferase family 61 protein [Methylovirgula sp.]
MLRFFEGLIRSFAKGSSRVCAGAHFDEATCVPIDELGPVVRASCNGGSYLRTAPTLIVGPTEICQPVWEAMGQKIDPPRLGVAEIDSAIVCGEGIVWKKTPDGPRVVSESLLNADSARSILPMKRTAEGGLCVKRNTRVKTLPRGETYAYLRQVWDTNYGHWLIDCLPKVGILAEHFDLAGLKFIVTRRSGPMRKVYVDSLGAFGIRPDQIVAMGREAVEVERLLYPLPVAMHYWFKAPRAIQILEALRDRIAPNGQGPKRLYVSRALARNRHLLNEAEILDVLEEFDVTIVYPERLSFVEQVRLFANADLVIGNCGANLANAVFARRGLKIFAITSQIMGDMFYWDLANLKSGKYFSLHGQAVCRTPDYNSDFSINAQEFRALLEEKVLRS